MRLNGLVAVLLAAASCGPSLPKTRAVVFRQTSGLSLVCYKPVETSATYAAAARVAADTVAKILKSSAESPKATVTAIRSAIPTDAAAIYAIDYNLCEDYAKGFSTDYFMWAQVRPAIEGRVRLEDFYSPSETPQIGDFPPYGVLLVVKQSSERTKDDFVRAVSTLSWRVRQEVLDPYTYVISGFLLEPMSGTERRIRRAAFMARIAPHNADRRCADLFVTWFSQTKGVEERTWRRDADDSAYSPSFRTAVMNITRVMPECR